MKTEQFSDEPTNGTNNFTEERQLIMGFWTERLFSTSNLERCDSELESWRDDCYSDSDSDDYDDDDLCF